MKIIESAKNDWIKQIKKLEKKKFRDLENRYLIEGEHLVEEALNYGGDIQFILVTEESLPSYAYLLEKIEEDKKVQVTYEVIKHLSTLPSPQPIMAIVGKVNKIATTRATSHVLLLDNVQDPGNVGTMIRTADAAGFSKVVLGKGTADVYSPKVVRSMQGSQFHIKLEETELIETIAELREEAYQIYGTELNEEAISFKDIKKSEKIAILMGNEGQGVSADLLKETDQNIFIPMKGHAESLNVAVAAGIVMFSL